MYTADIIYYVYIMTNTHRGVLYTGMTRDLPGRACEHRDGLIPGFAKRYGCNRLVWYEPHLDAARAADRERAIKRWRRSWKIELVERDNPTSTALRGESVGSAPTVAAPARRRALCGLAGKQTLIFDDSTRRRAPLQPAPKT